ncbi:MAG TPA: alpha/beta hydrolase [Micropepsaceae bacterium]|jgi:triacylglycerol lipase|nr:alpha/beta hydrolase [Micropepsaceae bacterium]
MKRMLLPLVLAALAAPTMANADLPKDVQASIAKMGHVNDPKTAPLFAPFHTGGIPADIKVSRDLAFGSDAAQKVDIFTDGKGAGKPILIYVHGGGFTRGDKHRPGEFMYDNVMIWAVQHGMVAAQTNYRLAPQAKYPAANDDVAAGVKYVRDHAREYGGDPNKIFVWGHSAGASLVAIMVSHPQFVQASGGKLAGAFITSGQYEFKAPHPYAGDDPAKVAEVNAVEGLKKTDIPLFFTRAEWDMPSQMQQGDMIDKTLTAAGKEHGFHLMSGHNHMSQVYSIGTNETQLSDRMLDFIKAHAGNAKSASAQ